MLCAPLDWQYAELPSSASDAVLCSVLVRKMWDIKTNRKKKKKKNQNASKDFRNHQKENKDYNDKFLKKKPIKTKNIQKI